MSSPKSPLYVLPFDEVRHDVPTSDSATAVVYEWGGDGPPLFICHATGLHAHCYAPLVSILRKHFSCYGLDARGQGAASLPATGEYAWTRITDDVTDALDLLGLSGRGDVYGIGHSQGGFLIMSAAVRRPGTFAGLFAYEAVMFPPEFDGQSVDNRMATMARRRREVFDSKQAAYDNYREKPPLNSIDDNCLRAYVEWGFDELDDGTARLTCRAETEALLFEGGRHSYLGLCAEVLCRTTVGLGDVSPGGFNVAVPLQAKTLPDGQLIEFPGRSHFGLLERVDDMAATIVEMFLG